MRWSDHDLVFGLGPAGTGKTFLAVAHGAALLRSGEVERLVVARPAVEAGERLGFLPGDLTEKVDPYMAPVWDAMTTILGAEALRKRRDRGEIEVAPIAFMRGRTLAHAFVLVDEAQNASRLQMKMLLTRLGEGREWRSPAIRARSIWSTRGLRPPARGATCWKGSRASPSPA